MPQVANTADEQQRSAIKDACWMQAQRILSDSWAAVQALAMRLLKRRTLDGKEVHRLIWQTLGSPDADWRFGALQMQQESRK
jgi:ATP-dependent Zn protease